jgi:hypothetical protein
MYVVASFWDTLYILEAAFVRLKQLCIYVVTFGDKNC